MDEQLRDFLIQDNILVCNGPQWISLLLRVCFVSFELLQNSVDCVKWHQWHLW